MKFRVACLMGTYGRYTLATEALACFLQQTAIDDALLLVYNQHPVPLIFDHPRVRVLNEVPPRQRLRDVRQRMVALMSDDDAEFVHYWDDDDLYLPWHLEDCLAHIGTATAWRPGRSWYTARGEEFALHGNRFEASWLIRAQAMRDEDVNNHPDFMEHPFILSAESAGLVKTTEMGDFASYIYRWGVGVQHVSAYGTGGPEAQTSNIDAWRKGNRDVRSDGRLIPPDLWPHWSAFLNGIRHQVSPDNFAEIETRLSLAVGASKLSSVQYGTPT